MRALVGLGPVLVLVLTPLCGLPAQEAAEPTGDVGGSRAAPSGAAEGVPAADQTSPTGQAGPQAAKFQQVLAEWKELVARLGALQLEYQEADPSQRAEIRRKWDVLIDEGEAMESELIAAAERAFLEAPHADPEVTELLVGVLVGHVESTRYHTQTDNYEQAMHLAKLLLDHGCRDKRVYNAAGIAAFALNDFDAAEEYLKLAARNESITDTGETYLDAIAECREAWAKEKQLREAEARADDLPRVLLKTSKGDIEVELFENEAPNTVANFISLVESGFYDGLTFHRVLPAFMAQAGCPEGTGSGGPGYTIPCECHRPDHRNHFRGSLSMAHAGRDTGGSQFFITFLPTPHLNGKHTVFGRVIRGFDVLHKLQRRDPSRPDPPQPDKILEAKVLRKRDHPYRPKTLPEKR